MLQNLLLLVQFWIRGKEFQSYFTIFLLTSGKPVSWENSVKYGQDEFMLLYIFLVHSWVLRVVHEYLHGQRYITDQRNEITEGVINLD